MIRPIIPKKKYSLSDILESFSISFAIHAVLPNNRASDRRSA